MPEFLTTLGTSNAIEKLIRTAVSHLTLVTPYLKLSNNMVHRIRYACNKGIKITLIYGKSELAKNEKEILESLDNIRIYFCENLHAKCYFNEEHLILTSMNLYEYSQNNNREMGIEFYAKTDQKIYDEVIEEINAIIDASVLKQDFRALEKTKLIDKNTILRFTPSKNMETSSFHIPTLLVYFKLILPEESVTLDQEDYKIYIKDFPQIGINIEVSNRILMRFKEQNKYDQIANILDHNSEKLESCAMRIFPKDHLKRIYIYSESSFTVTEDQNGVEKMVSKFLYMLNTIISISELSPNQPLIQVKGLFEYPILTV